MNSDGILEELAPLDHDFKEKLKAYVTERLKEFLDDEVMSAGADKEVDAENVCGLRSFVQDIVDDSAPFLDADNISGLKNAVQEVVNNLSFEISVS
jgi:hypothetical protein